MQMRISMTMVHIKSKRIKKHKQPLKKHTAVKWMKMVRPTPFYQTRIDQRECEYIVLLLSIILSCACWTSLRWWWAIGASSVGYTDFEVAGNAEKLMTGSEGDWVNWQSRRHTDKSRMEDGTVGGRRTTQDDSAGSTLTRYKTKVCSPVPSPTDDRIPRPIQYPHHSNFLSSSPITWNNNHHHHQPHAHLSRLPVPMTTATEFSHHLD